MTRSTHQEPSTAIALEEFPNAIRSLIHAVDKDLESIACALITVRGKSDQPRPNKPHRWLPAAMHHWVSVS